MNMRGDSKLSITKSKITEALLKLLEDKPIGRVSVIELCKQAQVNRTSFYAYYSDIFDLIESLETEISASLYENLGEDNGERDIAVIVGHIRQNSRFYKIYANTAMESKLVSHMLVVAQKAFGTQLLIEQSGLSAAREYFMEFVKGGVMGVIKLWLASDCNVPDSEIVEFLIDVVKKCHSGAFSPPLRAYPDIPETSFEG
ncbi:MAG: TetR family transcriptional regulator C-terminal domain-containing protein [Clostridiales bacterium]|jgi:AcrR family transcriptional regulator|nr:TetR family transcriptional regulator C-terminal domain-containing protein [Clostridiales bacterium]